MIEYPAPKSSTSALFRFVNMAEKHEIYELHVKTVNFKVNIKNLPSVTKQPMKVNRDGMSPKTGGAFTLAPKNFVAVTELIPDIFVALSPIIFPFAFISPVKVEIPRTCREFVFISAVLPVPVKLLPSPKYVTIPLTAVIIPEDICTDPKVEIPLTESAEPTILFATTDPPVN